MKRPRRAVWPIAIVALLSCGRFQSISTRDDHSPHAALRAEAVSRLLATRPHRLAVVFWPQLGGCAACDLMVAEVVQGWKVEPESEIAVVTVVPASAPNTVDHLALPGDLVRLDPEEYKQLAGRAPRPRVEIWSSDGELLLFRTVPNYGSQANLLTEEMLAARSYTAPVAYAAGARTGHP
jgi:hypothetical protein